MQVKRWWITRAEYPAYHISEWQRFFDSEAVFPDELRERILAIQNTWFSVEKYLNAVYNAQRSGWVWQSVELPEVLQDDKKPVAEKASQESQGEADSSGPLNRLRSKLGLN